MHVRRIAFIEAPIQCLFLRANNPDIENVEVYLVRRRGWPVPEDSMVNFFNPNHAEVINGIIAIVTLIRKRIFCTHVTIGSHLGKLNKILIIISLILNYRVTLLDDGLYGIRFHDWVFSVGRFFKNLKWSSFFYKDSSNKIVSSYCLISQQSRFQYKDTLFLVLSDYKSLGISENREKLLIEKALGLAFEREMKLLVLPHRRGRLDLYESMSLSLFSEETLCFEDWYIESAFDNCMIIAYSSSIWQILEDNRMETALIDLGLNNSDWVLDRIKVGSIIKI